VRAAVKRAAVRGAAEAGSCLDCRLRAPAYGIRSRLLNSASEPGFRLLTALDFGFGFWLQQMLAAQQQMPRGPPQATEIRATAGRQDAGEIYDEERRVKESPTHAEISDSGRARRGAGADTRFP
jgi:hypothetical protein